MQSMLEPPTGEHPSLLPSSWAMRLFGYTPERRSAFWQMVASRGVPRVRVGPRKIMFDESQVRDWIARRSTTGAQ